MRAQRAATIWPLACLAVVAVVALDCGLDPLPPHFPIPSPQGHPPIAFHCDPPAGAAPPVTVPVPFDATLRNWPEHTGAFAAGQPIAEASIRARDVAVHLDPTQQSLLPAGAAIHASSLVPIGGDYWSDTPYPIAASSNAAWVSSSFRTGAPLPDRESDDLVGVLSSVPFALTGTYLRMYVGGDSDPGVGVELLVKPVPGRDLSACDAAPAQPQAPKPPAGFVVARVRRGTQGASASDRELLEAVEIPLDAPRCDVRGLTAVLRVFDTSRSAHVNVGTFALADAPLTDEDRDIPVWGFGDYHAHPTSYLSFGGLQGIHTLWGAPGGSMHEYVGNPAAVRRNFARDIPACDDANLHFNGHHGGPAAPIMINAAEGRLAPSIDDLKLGNLTFDHASKGGPTFSDFPSFQSGAHEQYHVTQIHRAYLGGLRLMSALALHNRGIEYGVGWVRCGDGGNATVDTTSDWTVIRAHVRAMKQLAELNHDWMEIAYSPADARRIIRANKLAVVLGVEVPQLGMDADGTPAEQVRNLEALGVRQVILVHGMDNLLGGTAVFEDLYNTVNDWMYRPAEFRDKVETLSGTTVWKQYPASFYEVTTDPSPPVTTLPAHEPIEPTEPILYHLANPERVVLSDMYPRPPSYNFLGNRFGLMHALVSTNPLFLKPQGLYDRFRGPHRNVRGLTGRGAEFIERLMQRGMLVDMAHMSDASLASTYDVAGEACGSYPLMISHAHFRPLQMKVDHSALLMPFVEATGDRVRADLNADSLHMRECVHDHAKCDRFVLDAALKAAANLPPGTTDREGLPREYDIASSEVQQVRVRNGVIGVFLGQGNLDAGSFTPADLPGGLRSLPIALDCGGSSQGFAAAMLYARAHMKGMGGLGVTADFSLVGSVAPRFGPDACAGYLGAGTSSGSGAQLLETLLDPGHYRFEQQKDAVNYGAATVLTCAHGTSKKAGVPCGSNAPLEPYVMGDRTYDFNVDGLAHYGLVPDLLQDVANQLHDARGLALDEAFQSANAYIAMWSQARRLSGCETNGMCSEPVALPDPQCAGATTTRPECGNSCPCGWNRGAPLHEIQEVYGACDPGKPITLPGSDPQTPGATRLIYAQRRADPSQSGDLGVQGDWAVYHIQVGQTWKCGADRPRTIGCPDAAGYVKVRRILDTTVSTIVDRCDSQPLPPEDGDRSVLFQCLVGPPDDMAGGP